MSRIFDFVDAYDKRVLPDRYVSPGWCELGAGGYGSTSQSGSGELTGIDNVDFVRAAYEYIKSLEAPKTYRVGFGVSVEPYSLLVFPMTFKGNVTGIPAGQESDYEIRVFRCPFVDPASDVFLGVATIAAGGAWSIGFNFGGNKTARLYQISTGEFITDGYVPLGLLRSYGDVPVTDPRWDQRTRIAQGRDMAFAVIVAATLGDLSVAERWAHALSQLIYFHGFVPEEVSVLTRLSQDLFYRTDTQFWAGYAFMLFCQKYPTSIYFANFKFLALFCVVDAIINRQVLVPVDPRYGLFAAGYGVYVAPTYAFALIDRTEAFLTDNVAGLYAMRKYIEVFPSEPFFTSYIAAALALTEPALKAAWNPTALRSRHGIDISSIDDRHNLEDVAWYALGSRTTGNVGKQLDTLALLENYRISSGMVGYLAQYGYLAPEVDGLLDFPTTAIAGLALFASGQEAQHTELLSGLNQVWQVAGFPNHFLNDPSRVERDRSSLAAAVFSILLDRPNGFLEL